MEGAPDAASILLAVGSDLFCVVSASANTGGFCIGLIFLSHYGIKI